MTVSGHESTMTHFFIPTEKTEHLCGVCFVDIYRRPFVQLTGYLIIMNFAHVIVNRRRRKTTIVFVS